jgi:hypothetical protein
VTTTFGFELAFIVGIFQEFFRADAQFPFLSISSSTSSQNIDIPCVQKSVALTLMSWDGNRHPNPFRSDLLGGETRYNHKSSRVYYGYQCLFYLNMAVYLGKLTRVAHGAWCF